MLRLSVKRITCITVCFAEKLAICSTEIYIYDVTIQTKQNKAHKRPFAHLGRTVFLFDVLDELIHNIAPNITRGTHISFD